VLALGVAFLCRPSVGRPGNAYSGDPYRFATGRSNSGDGGPSEGLTVTFRALLCCKYSSVRCARPQITLFEVGAVVKVRPVGCTRYGVRRRVLEGRRLFVS
jgi:hypothetical protein